MKKPIAVLTGLALAVPLSAGMVIATAGLSSAHNNSVKADCKGLKVDLTSYNTQQKKGEDRKNSVTVWVDGQQADHDNDFGSSYSKNFAFVNEYVAHTYRVKVKAWDDANGSRGWTFDTKTVDVKACEKPEQPKAEKETRPAEGTPDCEKRTVPTWTEERTREFVWDGDSWEPGEWSQWTKVEGSDSTREATTEECPVTTPTPTPTPTDTGTPTPTPTPSETETPTPTPTPSETETPTPTPTPSETETPTPSPSASTPSVTPTAHSTTSPPARPRLVQTDTPEELAQTGSSLTPLLFAGALLALGIAALTIKRLLPARRH